MYKLYLFLMRFMITMLSYRTALVLGVLGGFLGLLQFIFMGNFLTDGNSFPSLQQYGGNLLSYLIIGTAFTTFVGVSLNSFQGTIRSEQQMGTLEFLLISNTRLELILLYAGAMNFIQAFINVAIMLSVVIFIFKIPLGINLFGAFIAMTLTITALSGIGLMSAGIIIITKVGDPITWVFTSLTGLVSGVFFPVDYLPEWLRMISAILPTTHALHALRMTLMQNAGLGDIQQQMFILIIMTIITIPSGLMIVRIGFNRARRVGSLSQY